MKKNDADDIEVLYRDAKDKRNQINIICELYPAYTKDEIKAMLQERGYTIPRIYTKRKSKEEDKAAGQGPKKTMPAAGSETKKIMPAAGSETKKIMPAAGSETQKKTPAAGQEKSKVPESVLEAVRKQIVEVSSIIDDYQNKIADLNTAMMEQQDKLQELDGFLKTYKG